jgi:hypothetical protein
VLSQHACVRLLHYALYSGAAPTPAKRLLEASRSGAFRHRVGWHGIMSALLLCGDDGSLCLQAAAMSAADTEGSTATPIDPLSSDMTGGGGSEWREQQHRRAAAAALYAALRAAGVSFEHRLSVAWSLLSSLSDAKVLLVAARSLPLPQTKGPPARRG